MIDLIMAVLGIMILAAALLALHSKDIVSAIMSAGAVSLLASILYLLVGAPDVAMTEAAIGSALSTVIFLFAWSRIRALRAAGVGGAPGMVGRRAGVADAGPVGEAPIAHDDFDEIPRVPGGGTHG